MVSIEKLMLMLIIIIIIIIRNVVHETYDYTGNNWIQKRMITPVITGSRNV